MKLVKIFALVAFAALISMSFQNCSPSQNSGLLGSKSSLAEQATAADAITQNAPFAYDMVLDTISYNSCVGSDLNNSGIFGIRMGANEGYSDNTGSGAIKAGLKLRSDFLTYIGKNISPIYPSTVVLPSQIKYVLQNSTANKNAYVQYAVRHRTDLSVAVDQINPPAGAAVVPPRDGNIEQAVLNGDPVLSGLINGVVFGEKGVVLSEGSRLSNLYEASAVQPIQASFGYSNYTDDTYPVVTTTPDGNQAYEPFGFGEAYSDRVRQHFNSSGTDKYILTLTYGNPLDGSSDFGLSSPARPSSTDKTKAYGRAYAFQFTAASSKAGWRANLLKQITETNLSDNSPVSGASWSCENYVIMKQNQWNNPKAAEPSCAALNSTDLQNSTLAAKVKRIRRQYIESDWNIGLFYPKNSTYTPAGRALQPLCLVPKKNECYLQTTMPDGTDIGVNYDSSTECYLFAASAMGVSYTGNPNVVAQRALGRCAQYASVCVRTSTNY